MSTSPHRLEQLNGGERPPVPGVPTQYEMSTRRDSRSREENNWGDMPFLLEAVGDDIGFAWAVVVV